MSLFVKKTASFTDSKFKIRFTDKKKKIKYSSYIRKFRMEQLQRYTYMRMGFIIYEEMLLHSKFSYIREKFDFLFYQCFS